MFCRFSRYQERVSPKAHFQDGYKRSSHSPLFSHWKLVTLEERSTTNADLDVHDISLAIGSADVIGRGRSLRAVALAGGRWSLSLVMSSSWHSATVVLSRSLMPPSNLCEPSWFQESHGQLCGGNRELSGKFFVFSAVIGVFGGLMSASARMHRKRASRSRFVKDVVSLLRRWGVSLGTDTVPEQLQVHWCQVTCASVDAADAALRDSSSDEGGVSLTRRESRADFLEASLQLGDPSEWKLAALGGYFREENTIILEARSILYDVRYAENRLRRDAS